MSVIFEHRLIRNCSFALVNPLDVDQAQWADLPHHPLIAAHLKASPRQLPILIDLLSLTRESRQELVARAWTWERANGNSFFCGLIESPEPVERMVSHLSRRLLIKNAAGPKLLLRFYDPRVFEHLRWIFTPVQLAALMGPASVWYWLDGGGQWQREVRPELKTYSLRLESQQLLALGRIGTLNRILKSLRRTEPNRDIDISLIRKIEGWLRDALEEGLSEVADLQLYISQSLKFHPGIQRHPALVNALHAVQMGHCTYVGACLRVNDEELHHSKEAQ